MKIRPDQLAAQLNKSLAPIYLLFGEEPLLLQECLDQLRTATDQAGYSEKQQLQVTTGFDWSKLLATANTLSLFSSKKLIELSMPTGKPGDKGGKALREYCELLPQDTCLVIRCEKIDTATQKTKWFKTLEKAACVVQAWPMDTQQLPRWLQQRAQQRGLHLSQDSLLFISEQATGNLLAAAQDIEKLYLAYGAGEISIEQVTASVSDNARFNVFDLADAYLQGDNQKTLRTLSRLREEGIEPPLVLWALTREIRLLAQISHATLKGQSLEQAIQAQRIWRQRIPLVKKALSRHEANYWQQSLSQAAQIDLIIKGAMPGNTWLQLERLCLAHSL